MSGYHLSITQKALPCPSVWVSTQIQSLSSCLHDPRFSCASAPFHILSLCLACPLFPLSATPLLPAGFYSSSKAHVRSFIPGDPFLIPQSEFIPATSFPIAHSIAFLLLYFSYSSAMICSLPPFPSLGSQGAHSLFRTHVPSAWHSVWHLEEGQPLNEELVCCYCPACSFSPLGK